VTSTWPLWIDWATSPGTLFGLSLFSFWAAWERQNILRDREQDRDPD